MKNMDLDIPVASSTLELMKLKPKLWIPPECSHLQSTVNTTVECRLCKGNGIVYVESPDSGLTVKKYCFHCKGEGVKRI